jgi:hypothetical protein
MRVVDLLTVVQRRIEDAVGVPVRIEEVAEDLWVRVDSFALVQAIASLAARLRSDYGIRALQFRAGGSERFAELDLVWTGAIVGSDALALWESEPMRIGADETPLTLRGIPRAPWRRWSQADKARQIAWFRFLLPLGERVAAAAPSGDRQPANTTISTCSTHRDNRGIGRAQARGAFLYGVRHRDYRPRAVGRRRDHLHRCGARGQQPAAQVGGLRAARQSAPADIA